MRRRQHLGWQCSTWTSVLLALGPGGTALARRGGTVPAHVGVQVQKVHVHVPCKSYNTLQDMEISYTHLVRRSLCSTPPLVHGHPLLDLGRFENSSSPSKGGMLDHGHSASPMPPVHGGGLGTWTFHQCSQPSQINAKHAPFRLKKVENRLPASLT